MTAYYQNLSSKTRLKGCSKTNVPKRAKEYESTVVMYPKGKDRGMITLPLVYLPHTVT